jgi:hypothetical protein
MTWPFLLAGGRAVTNASSPLAMECTVVPLATQTLIVGAVASYFVTGAPGAKYMPEEPESAMPLLMSGGLGVGLRLGSVVKADSFSLVKLLSDTMFQAIPHRWEVLSPC